MCLQELLSHSNAHVKTTEDPSVVNDNDSQVTSPSQLTGNICYHGFLVEMIHVWYAFKKALQADLKTARWAVTCPTYNLKMVWKNNPQSFLWCFSISNNAFTVLKDKEGRIIGWS